MKQIIFAHVLIALLLTALFSVFSYGHGAGYVYVFWRDWQVQTNIWFVLCAIFVFSVLLQLLWLGLKRYLGRLKRQSDSVAHFSELHPYEQLAVIWLLEAAQEQQSFIQNSFAQSTLLKQVIDSRLYWGEQHYDQALLSLKDAHATAFELAELQRIKIFLSLGDGEKVLTHLEFLSQHELSPWLNQVKSAYEIRLQTLWGHFAIRFPWLYLKATHYGLLNLENKRAWLENILLSFEQASAEQILALQQRYHDLSPEIESRSYDIKVLWLKVLARLPDMSEAHEKLAVHLLEQQFNQDVFYLWFQQQLLKQNPNYLAIEQHILDWEVKYPSLPVLNFAKWHVYQATDRQEQAEGLLALYPDDVLMNYLRIKSHLKHQEDLVAQLNSLFVSNTNFIAIQI